MLDFRRPFEFQWDEGNITKSYEKHGVLPKETEELFLDENVLFIEDIFHSQRERRYIAIGQTTQKKILFAVFTLRGKSIRIISARRVNKKERRHYETIKKDSLL